MINTILILMVVAAVLLIVVILVQNPKGGGLSSEFGGGATSQMFGVQKTGDILEKLTWGFFTFIIVGALATGLFLKNSNGTSANSALDVESTQAAPVAPSQATPLTTPAPALPVE